MTAPVHEWGIGALRAALSEGSVTSRGAVEACVARAKETERFGAYLHLDEDGALASADAADARRTAGDVAGPLDGIPVALKDILLTKGAPTTCGSKILEGFRAPYDATVVRKLEEAGAVILGKLNMDEFAMGSSNEHSAYGPALNPWDAARVPGGSSGGSAVAVALGSAFATLGTDTGGSIRQPASLCGVVGLKPTYGRVSRFGVIAFASSLDQVGPLTKTVTDCAEVAGVISGFDPRDSTSAQQPVPDYLDGIEQGVEGLRIGVPEEYFQDGMEPAVREAVENALDVYENMGAERVSISLPHTDYGIAAYYLVATAEASSNLARYDGVRYGLREGGDEGLQQMYEQSREMGFGTEVKRRIMLGTYALSAGYYDAYYRKAQQVRTLICRDFAQAFETCDVIATPTSPTTAFKLGENEADPITMYLADVFTVPCNLAGLPGLSLPCGFTEANLPIGLQLLAPHFSETDLFRVGRAYERETSWHERRAP